MSTLTDEIRRLRQDEPDVALILDTYEEAENIYREALGAMGVVGERMSMARDSSDVVVSFGNETTTSGHND